MAEHDETTEQTDPPADDNAGASPNAEAAKYRRRLRAAEAERDALAARVEGYRKSEIERVAAEAGMASPADLWAVGTDLTTLLTEEGEVDPDAVTTLVDDILSERPTWRRPGLDLGQGARNGVPARASWATALRSP